VKYRVTQTHQFEPGFSVRSDSDRLEAVLSRDFVIEPKESLMRLNASPIFCLGNLKRDSQDILGAELNRRGFFCERDTEA